MWEVSEEGRSPLNGHCAMGVNTGGRARAEASEWGGDMMLSMGTDSRVSKRPPWLS